VKVITNVSIFSDKDIKQLREINKRLDAIEDQLAAIQKLLLPFKYLPPELELAIRRVGRQADSIDKQVPDLETVESISQNK
jgi:hypothetical protein